MSDQHLCYLPHCARCTWSWARAWCSLPATTCPYNTHGRAAELLHTAPKRACLMCRTWASSRCLAPMPPPRWKLIPMDVLGLGLLEQRGLLLNDAGGIIGCF